MRIAVMGAGAVGCFYGALLAKAGHEIVLIGRPAHVEAIRQNGLILDWAAGEERIAVEAQTSPQAVAGADLVLVCVKSGDTEAVAAEMAPHLAANALLLSLQNGVGNAQRLAKLLGRNVLGAAVYVAAAMAGPGHVRHFGRQELAIGAGPGAQTLAEMFRAAGIPTDISETLDESLWAKLATNCAYNALSAITRQPYGVLLASEGIESVIRNLVGECEAVAAACGVALPPRHIDNVLALASTMPGQLSSTAQDMIRGRPTEIDYLNGHVVRLGAEFGIPTPVNQAVTAIVKVLEAKR